MKLATNQPLVATGLLSLPALLVKVGLLQPCIICLPALHCNAQHHCNSAALISRHCSHCYCPCGCSVVTMGFSASVWMASVCAGHQKAGMRCDFLDCSCLHQRLPTSMQVCMRLSTGMGAKPHLRTSWRFLASQERSNKSCKSRRKPASPFLSRCHHNHPRCCLCVEGMPAVLLAGNACKRHLCCCDLKLEPMTSLHNVLHHVITVWKVLRHQLLIAA